jgi:hypothetical protein
MARSGLRMMPTFPLPSLKFRTAGFPRYGFKAGVSDRACPCDTAHVSLGLPPSFALPAAYVGSPFCVGGRCALKHLRSNGFCRSTPGALARSGPSSSVSAHPRLIGPIRPTRRHIPISPHCGLYQMPSLCTLRLEVSNSCGGLSLNACYFAQKQISETNW